MDCQAHFSPPELLINKVLSGQIARKKFIHINWKFVLGILCSVFARFRDCSWGAGLSQFWLILDVRLASFGGIWVPRTIWPQRLLPSSVLSALCGRGPPSMHVAELQAYALGEALSSSVSCTRLSRLAGLLKAL